MDPLPHFSNDNRMKKIIFILLCNLQTIFFFYETWDQTKSKKRFIQCLALFNIVLSSNQKYFKGKA